MKYRIKQVGNKFYPQWKRKLFGWGYYQGKPYMDYGASSLITCQKEIFYEPLYYDIFEEASEYLDERKKADTVIYHKF